MTEDTPIVATRERSPNYPSVGLPLAIEYTRKLWASAKRAAVSPETAAQIIGYNSLSGPARSAIGALRQYDLLGAGQGTVALSELAINILVHGEDTVEWRDGIAAAAAAPAIFGEINAAYPGANDQVIKAYLISKRRFSEDGAGRLLKAYRETMSLVNRVPEGYDQAAQRTDRASGESMQTSQLASSTQINPGQKVTRHSVPLADGMLMEILFVGRAVLPEDIEAAEKYLKFQKELLPKPLPN